MSNRESGDYGRAIQEQPECSLERETCERQMENMPVSCEVLSSGESVEMV